MPSDRIRFLTDTGLFHHPAAMFAVINRPLLDELSRVLASDATGAGHAQGVDPHAIEGGADQVAALVALAEEAGFTLNGTITLEAPNGRKILVHIGESEPPFTR